MGFSGGVDSTTLAAILSPVLGKKLICVAIDTGGVRAGEFEEIKANAKSAGVKNLVIIPAANDWEVDDLHPLSEVF